MQLESKLISAIQQAFLAIYRLTLEKEECVLKITRKEFKGHFSLPVFAYSKRCKVLPMQLAEKIGHWMQTHTDLVSAYHVVDGFLNIVIHDAVWIAILEGMVQDATYGCLAPKGKRVIIEFSCPNTNKPQHLGHLRNNFFGDSLAALLDAAGYTVYKVNLINDRGIHICKSMVAYQHFGSDETPEGSGLKGDHLVGKYYVKFDQIYKEQRAAIVQNEGDDTVVPPILQEAQKMLVEWEQGNPSVVNLWKKMNGWVYKGFQETYNRLGIVFDKTYYESDTYLLGKKIVEEGLDRKIFYKKEDRAIAVGIDGLDEKILLRSDGTAVYITQDLGTADLRYADYCFDKMIYVVGNEQAYHFKVLFAIVARLGRPYATSMCHLSYGMIELPNGRMKSREGNVVDADHLIEEMVDTVKLYTEHSHKIDQFDQEALKQLYDTLAIGALKFFLLRVSPQKNMLFDPKESIDFHGDTGTFIQYSYARICSLQRRAGGIETLASIQIVEPLHPLEQELIFQLYRFPAQVEEASATYMPSIIAQYALELAKIYNRFYACCPIWSEPNPCVSRFRLLLSACVGRFLKKSMTLLTIELPEQM